MSLIFLEAVVHSWLYVKGLYPNEAFVSRNLFGIGIKAVGENTLKTYISEFFKAIEELHNKGILHCITLQLIKEKKIAELFMVKLTWIANVYGLADNDKVVSHVELDSFFGKILNEMYSETGECNKENTFQIVIETVKEEASEADEVLARDKWALVSLDTENCKMSEVANGIVRIDWGYVDPIINNV